MDSQKFPHEHIISLIKPRLRFVVTMGTKAVIYRIPRYPQYLLKITNHELVQEISECLYDFLHKDTSLKGRTVEKKGIDLWNFDRCRDLQSLLSQLPKNVLEQLKGSYTEIYSQNVQGPTCAHSPIPLEHPEFLGRNFGQPMASYGDNVTLLPLIPGVPCGITPPILGAFDILDNILRHPVVLKKFIRLHIDNTHRVSGMSLEAYKLLLEDLRFLDEIKRSIDAVNPNNLLVDRDHNRFHLIDIIRHQPNTTNNPRLLLGMMMDYHYAEKLLLYSQFAAVHFDEEKLEQKQREDIALENNPELIKLRRIILEKFLTACEALGARLDKPGPLNGRDPIQATLDYAGYQINSLERRKIEGKFNRLGYDPDAYEQKGVTSLERALLKPNHNQAQAESEPVGGGILKNVDKGGPQA